MADEEGGEGGNPESWWDTVPLRGSSQFPIVWEPEGRGWGTTDRGLRVGEEKAQSAWVQMHLGGGAPRKGGGSNELPLGKLRVGEGRPPETALGRERRQRKQRWPGAMTSSPALPAPAHPAPAPLGGASHCGVGEGAWKAWGLEGGRPGGGGSPVHALRGPSLARRCAAEEPAQQRGGRAPRTVTLARLPHRPRPVPSASDSLCPSTG